MGFEASFAALVKNMFLLCLDVVIVCVFIEFWYEFKYGYVFYVLVVEMCDLLNDWYMLIV